MAHRFMMLYFTIALLSLNTLHVKSDQYRGYRLLSSLLQNDQEKQKMNSYIENKQLNVWQWKNFNNFTVLVDIMCGPGDCNELEDYMNDNKISYRLKINDIQNAIDAENPKDDNEEDEEWENRGGHRLTWRKYHPYSDIESYLGYLEGNYPDLCKLGIIGNSSEGRALKVVSINYESTKKPTIWIDGGMHAREWISTTSATYILRQLIEYQHEKDNKELLMKFNWHIIPLLNPDGYEYSRTRDRFWRKSRSHHSACVGVDLNRNFGYEWRRGTGRCGEINPGPYPFSEPETQAMSEFILANKNDIKAAISLHSYSQMWLLPWGYTDEKPKDYYDMYLPAEAGVAAIKAVRGTEYLLGTSPELIYKTRGSSDDWTKGAAGIEFSYTIELPDTGDYGFMLPPSEIEPVGEELWQGIVAFAKALPIN